MIAALRLILGLTQGQRAAEAAANLDALCSLAIAAEELAAACPDVCTPRVLPQPTGGRGLHSSTFQLHLSRFSH
jgi:hypothetical protein